jgi:hypothetical protein
MSSIPPAHDSAIPAASPLFTQYAMWLNFVENYGGVRHAVRNR